VLAPFTEPASAVTRQVDGAKGASRPAPIKLIRSLDMEKNGRDMAPRVPLRARLRERAPLIGTLVTLDSPEAVEVLAESGFDWLFIDMEHSPVLDTAAVQRLVQAVAGRVHTLVRVPDKSPTSITRVLDVGCDGIIVPHVDDPDDAMRAVRAARYPPLGERSVGISRAHGYGLGFQEYMARANQDLVVVAQIEHIDAVDRIDRIVEVDGIAAAFVGPFDLSGSLGVLGQPDHESVRGAIDRVRAACERAGMPFGIFAATAEGARAERERRSTLIAAGSDLSLLAGAAGQVLATITANQDG
jgi:2-keto-3-deoxy-L-rhamnonate aldolase RhmA